jgi:hypothetical protein
MTKAKARLRAKAKAAEKMKKRAAGADQQDKQTPPGRFDPGNNSITSPMANASTKGTGPARRGSARSR